MTSFITNRLEERRNGDKESRRLNKNIQKSASTFISRRMEGVYQKDEQALETLSTQLQDLFDPQNPIQRLTDHVLE